jgi:hypothetical protein
MKEYKKKYFCQKIGLSSVGRAYWLGDAVHAKIPWQSEVYCYNRFWLPELGHHSSAMESHAGCRCCMREKIIKLFKKHKFLR